MKLLTLLSLVSSALAVAIVANKRDEALTVNIEKASDAGLKATVTNTGATAVKVLKVGSILDTNLVEKTEVYSGGKSYTSRRLLIHDPNPLY